MNNQNTVSSPIISGSALWYLLHTNELTEEQKKLAEAHTKGFDDGFHEGTQSENDRSFMQQEELIKKHKEELDKLRKIHVDEREHRNKIFSEEIKEEREKLNKLLQELSKQKEKAENKLLDLNVFLQNIRSYLIGLKRKRKTPGYSELAGQIEFIAKEISEILNG